MAFPNTGSSHLFFTLKKKERKENMIGDSSEDERKKILYGCEEVFLSPDNDCGSSGDMRRELKRTLCLESQNWLRFSVG